MAGNAYSLTAVNNTTDGATGLPVIAAKDNLTIVGNGDTIEPSTASGTPAFRLLDVASGASLTLENLTLQGGLALGSGVSAEGGGIYNQGTLDLNGVTVQNNTAQGQQQQPASGGGIWSSGSLTLEGGTTVQNNQAVGAAAASWVVGGQPESANGGGVCIAGGTATITDATLSSNTAQGGFGTLDGLGTVAGGVGLKPHVPGASGYGGGLYVAAGAVTLSDDTLSANAALGGSGGDGGNGYGGGVYVAGGSVTLSNDTLSADTATGGVGMWGLYEFKNNGGAGFGGGLYAAGGSVTMRDDTVTANAANGGAGSAGGAAGLGEGGGLYIAASATAYLDAFTVANVNNNTASTSDPNIGGGPYTLLS